jgi:hypothetical protein
MRSRRPARTRLARTLVIFLVGIIGTTTAHVSPAGATVGAVAFGCNNGGTAPGHLLVLPQGGAPVTLPITGSGSVSLPFGGGLLGNHAVGDNGGTQFRNLFTFAVPADIGIVTSARLEIGPQTWCTRGEGTHSYELWDITTDDLTYREQRAGRLWNDAGSGTSYGANPLTVPHQNSIEGFDLNAAGAAGITAAAGGRFAIGGTFDDSAGTIEVTNDANGNDIPDDLEGPRSAADCKDGGWRRFTSPRFKSQGDCVSYVATRGR